MSRPRLPLTELERQKLDHARTVAVFALLIGLTAAAFAGWFSWYRLAAITAAIPALYLLAVLAVPLRVYWLNLLLLAVMPAAAGYLLGYPLLGVLVGLALSAWSALDAVRGVRGISDPLRLLDATVVDPGAVKHIESFEALGFEPVGAYTFDTSSGQTVAVTVLIAPSEDEFALVTDLVLDVSSIFGSRMLLTANSGSAPLPPEYLRNTLRGAEPGELVAAHRRALELLARRGLTPDRFDRDRLVEMQFALEQRCVDWSVRERRGRVLQGLFASGLGPGPLDDGPSTSQQIEAWLGAASPVLAAT